VERNQTRFVFLNIGHFLDHLFMLIFASAAALALTVEWELSYAALIPYATPSFFAFGLFAIPAGWLADRWSRDGMMAIFFIGIGVSSTLTGLSDSPQQIAFGLGFIGLFAAIYHPVGLAMVVHGRTNTGVPLAVNGVFGNMGVASAALLTGLLIDTWGWRSAFIVPGVASAACGIVYYLFVCRTRSTVSANVRREAQTQAPTPPVSKSTIIRIFSVVLFTTVMGSLIFQGTTFTLPKVFSERLTDLAGTATLVGWYAFLVFSLAALAQLVVGYLVDNHSVRTVFAIVAILQATFFSLMTNLLGIASLLTSVAFMLVVFGQIPINDVLVGRVARSEWRSRAYALRSVVAFSVTALTIPLVAWVHATWGFAAMFGLLACAATLTFVAVLALPVGDAVVSRPSTAVT
jgi:MFS family permease